MISKLLLRGMLAGILAGVMSFAVAKVAGEPLVDVAIAFEESHEAPDAAAPAAPAATQAPAMAGHAHGGHDHGGATAAASEQGGGAVIGRATQASLGLFVGIVVYGAALGGLFSLAFAVAHGRIGPLDARTTAMLLAGAGYLALFVLPSLKYPPNPPAIGQPGTIGARTWLYLGMILISGAAAVMATRAGQLLLPALGRWNASLAGLALFVAAVAAAMLVLPAVDEVPADFPASTLWSFRVTSFAIQAVLWASLGLVFGALAQRLLAPQAREAGLARAALR